MRAKRDPTAGSWYVNHTGKLMKVLMVRYDGKSLSKAMIEYLDGRRIMVGIGAWRQLHLREYSLRVEERNELGGI